MDAEKAKYIRMTNMLAFGVQVINAVHLVFFAFYMLLDFFPYLIPDCIDFIVFIVVVQAVFHFNRQGRYLFAKNYFAVIVMLQLFFYCIVTGRDIGVHNWFFVTAAAAVLWSPKNETRHMLTMACLSLLCYVLVQILYTRMNPLFVFTPAQEHILKILVHYGVFSSIILFLLLSRSITIRTEHRLKQEQAKSEALLLNILPRPISERLKKDSSVIADQVPEATILFADIVDFTSTAEKMPPKRVVGVLNEIFSRFDELAQKYGLEKIKTIGDGYMAAAGIPLQRPDHAQAVADFALEILGEMGGLGQDWDHPLALRIGLNTGRVVAGVIGKIKFAYDLWGDAVNTASRMESHGARNRIQVSAATHEKLKHEYEFERRGMIEVKGKGPMETFFLLGKKS